MLFGPYRSGSTPSLIFRSAILQLLTLSRCLPLLCADCSWTIPSNIPVSAFGGQSLFGLFTQSIGEELAKFPQGPSIDDPFW